jgi:predicted lipoprotein with Yx(FWY)xxD motif
MTGTHGSAVPGFTTARARRRPRRMLRRGTALCGLAAAAVLAAACGSQGGSTSSPGGAGNAAAAKGVVSTRQLSGIGTVLVDDSGMTIYTPKQPQEVNGKIECTGSCLSFWFPVTSSSAKPGSGGLPGRLGTIHLANGTTQLTYNGRPLYTFRLDTAAGQAHGNNFHDKFGGTSFTWQVVTASGKAGGAASPAPGAGYSNQPGY